MDTAVLRRWWPLAAFLGLLVVAALAAGRSQPQLDRFVPTPLPPRSAVPLLPHAEPVPPPPSVVAAPDAVRDQPGWIGEAAVAVLVLVVVAIAAFAAWSILGDRRRRRRPDQPAALDTPVPVLRRDAVAAAVEAGIEELSDGDADPRRAVIACWLRLEQAAADAGTPRHPGDSPADLVGRLLAAHRVDPAVLDAFAAAYRQARYASHAVDDRLRDEAVEALRRVRSDLAAGTPA